MHQVWSKSIEGWWF